MGVDIGVLKARMTLDPRAEWVRVPAEVGYRR